MLTLHGKEAVLILSQQTWAQMVTLHSLASNLPPHLDHPFAFLQYLSVISFVGVLLSPRISNAESYLNSDIRSPVSIKNDCPWSFHLSQYFKCHVNASNFQINISGISPEQQRNLPTSSSTWRLSESKLYLPLIDFNSAI